MFLIAHESEECAKESAAVLRSLGAAACNLLSGAVETTGVRKRKLSKAALELEAAGFLVVRNVSTVFDNEFELVPTFLGEEALQALDEM